MHHARGPRRQDSVDGDTVPNGCADDTDAPKRTVPAVPPALAVSLKITAVQLPAAGCSTCALPYPPTPCGSECAASLPAGSTRMTRTLAFRFPVPDTLAGQAIDAFSRSWPRGTLNFTVPKLDAVPAQFVNCGLFASDSVTVACLTTEPAPKPRPDTATVCAARAALVTVTDHDAAAPGLPA